MEDPEEFLLSKWPTIIAEVDSLYRVYKYASLSWSSSSGVTGTNLRKNEDNILSVRIMLNMCEEKKLNGLLPLTELVTNMISRKSWTNIKNRRGFSRDLDLAKEKARVLLLDLFRILKQIVDKFHARGLLEGGISQEKVEEVESNKQFSNESNS
jgi:hypothetical protein